MPPNTRTTTSRDDPVARALNDPATHTRLIAAARACLRRHGSAIQDTSDAETLVSVAALRALQNCDSYNPDKGDVVAWLIGFVFTIARERRRKPFVTSSMKAPQLDDLVIDVAPAVDTVFANQEFVDRLMGQLSPDDRKLLHLKYFEDLTFAEIAERIGGNENALRVRHHRVIGRLRNHCGVAGGRSHD
jgi:RNA polymerase sigma-70 factor (ECF subfamily)